MLKELGSGAFGKIYLVYKNTNKKLYAMKALYKKSLIIKEKLKYAVSETNIMKTINHPFTIKIYYAFQTPHYLYLIMEFCPGSDLLLHLINKKVFTIPESQFYIAELILAV